MTNPRKCTKSTLAAYAATSYRPQTHGEGLNSWVYEYANASPLTKRWVGCGIEVAVHVAGEWRHEDPSGTTRDLAKNEIVRVTVGERYAHASRRHVGAGVQVGFVLYGERLRALEARAGGELRFRADAGRRDPELADFARAMMEGVENAELARIAEAYVLRHADVVDSPLVRAKKELERWMFNDLPIPMIAESAGTSATAFTRGFASTYGITPATYRIMLRTNAASRMLWMDPDRPLRDVAESCGFAN
ncbi:MAG TPA: helix-turn-helix domain-containing protein, partial [Labilithrix sp.]